MEIILLEKIDSNSFRRWLAFTETITWNDFRFLTKDKFKLFFLPTEFESFALRLFNP